VNFTDHFNMSVKFHFTPMEVKEMRNLEQSHMKGFAEYLKRFDDELNPYSDNDPGTWIPWIAAHYRAYLEKDRPEPKRIEMYYHPKSSSLPPALEVLVTPKDKPGDIKDAIYIIFSPTPGGTEQCIKSYFGAISKGSDTTGWRYSFLFMVRNYVKNDPALENSKVMGASVFHCLNYTADGSEKPNKRLYAGLIGVADLSKLAFSAPA